MIKNYKYLLICFYDEQEHICGLFKTLDEISTELNINRGTIYNNLNDINDYYYIIKDKKEYYIKKL